MSAQTDDLALIAPLEGAYVGLLDQNERDALTRLTKAGLAYRAYEGSGGFLGLPKVRINAAAMRNNKVPA